MIVLDRSTKIGLSFLFLLLFAGAAKAQTDVIDFESGRWVFLGSDTKVESYLGEKSLTGRAYLEGVEFENGTIEWDMAVEGSQAYAGIYFRMQSEADHELFYLRPQATDKFDALQYMPQFNGLEAWQLYSGDGFTAEAAIPFKRWFHVKMEVSGKQARVYLDNSDEPALVIDDLKHGVSKGSIGPWSYGSGLAQSVHFANFRYSEDNGISFEAAPEPKTPAGMITGWQLSQVFEANGIDTELSLDSQKVSTIAWQAISSESSGLVNIARFRKHPGKSYVLARTLIRSGKEQVKKLNFGYSDRINIFLNGKILFNGNSQFRSRDPGFLGIVGLNDAVFLDLKKGDNELVLMVFEAYGGWGYIGRLEDMEGLELQSAD
ncbi:MAG: hypothetical protein FVQ81_08180 [Candidatus Glassbacteria bacterium]|nr:hypothetical protein [Candidatus Glassbacteria bacterium]